VLNPRSSVGLVVPLDSRKGHMLFQIEKTVLDKCRYCPGGLVLLESNILFYFLLTTRYFCFEYSMEFFLRIDRGVAYKSSNIF
jgi:hypothetical protein